MTDLSLFEYQLANQDDHLHTFILKDALKSNIKINSSSTYVISSSYTGANLKLKYLGAKNRYKRWFLYKRLAKNMNRDFYRLKNTLMFSFLWTNNFLLTWEVYNIIIKLLIRFNLYCLYSFKYCRINIPYLSIYLNSVGGNMFSICLIALHKK